MIKCFVVRCIHNNDFINNVNGQFNIDWEYIAKISCNSPNTISVLDDNSNWIPFRLYNVGDENYINHYKLYFDVLKEFLLDNKKELNDLLTHF